MKKIIIRGFIGISDNATPEFLEKELRSANGDDIDLLFSSGGGFVFPGLEMANMVRNYPGRIVAKITGLAASMSSYIPMMADEVIAEDNAVFMIHNVSGFAFGDFREAEKVAKHLRSLRDVLAKAYMNKTGKSLEEIQGLMDDETFFYGDEIAGDGFADRMVESDSDDDNDRDTAVALAQAEIADCMAQMKASEIKPADDFNRAAAFLNNVVELQPPAAAGKTKQEASNMKSLKELLAENPNAQAEYDAALKAAADTARAEGETAGKEKGMAKMKAAIDSALPILASADYPQTVKDRVTAKMSTGDVDGLKDFVAIHDMNIQAAADSAAAEEQGEETQPGGATADLTDDGIISNDDQLASAVAQHNEQFGSKGGTE